jgi:hypothetical protein
LTAVAPGWAYVYADVGGVRSPEVLVQAFAALRVDSPVGRDSITGWSPVNRHDGPAKWPDGGQAASVTCAETKQFEYRDGRVRFATHYEGHCSLHAQNDALRLNPQPLRASALRVAKLAVVVYDELGPELVPVYRAAGFDLHEPHPCG